MWSRHRAILQHLCTFDRNWSKRCDRVAIDMQIVLNFLGKGNQCRLSRRRQFDVGAENQNIVPQLLIPGRSVLINNAGQFPEISARSTAIPHHAAACASHR
jgi:hypothetical protein